MYRFDELGEVGVRHPCPKKEVQPVCLVDLPNGVVTVTN